MTSTNQPAWESLRVRQYISLASVVCLGWECIITLSHEYTHVWKSRFTITKWLYLLLRYITLICQISNHVIATILFSRIPVSAYACSSWFAFQSAYLLIVIVLFELILFVRVYALYRRSRKVKLFLSLLFLYELVIMTYLNVRINRSFVYDDTCLLKETPKEVLGVSITPIITQAIVWGMTWYKQASTRGEPISSPIINVMFRDGLVVFLVVCVLFSFSPSYSLSVHVLTHNVWSGLASVLAIGGCRIIMNMLCLKIPNTDSVVELSSCVATGTNIDFFTNEMDIVVAEYSI